MGSFRTWVKYVEQGEFPDVRRSFAVLRCNQCSAAPCITICPVNAIHKRSDGIVDIDPKACIGCKACLQGCPYDALYIHDTKGTAQKCHFCAHRVEIGLAPACAVVCPTEAIVPGDFHDPNSRVSRMRSETALTVRKPEAGTGPNVFYLDAAPAAIAPDLTTTAGGYLWSQQRAGLPLEAERDEAMFSAAEQRARTTYSIDRKAPWGLAVSGYLFTKSIAAGAALTPLALLWPAFGEPSGRASASWMAIVALTFLALTSVLLVADLGRPERFLKILLRPNPRSWLARGAFALGLYGIALVALIAVAGLQFPLTYLRVVAGGTMICAGLAAAYTGWLFAQACGRPLWMRRGLWAHLVVQAAVAGAALALCATAIADDHFPIASGGARLAMLAALVIHAGFIAFEPYCAPRNREAEYHRAHRIVTRGPLARWHWVGGIGVGIVLPALLVTIVGAPWAALVAALSAAAGLWIEEDLLVRAGQALPIS